MAQQNSAENGFYGQDIQASKTFREWKNSEYGDYPDLLWSHRDSFKTENVLFFDVEFFPLNGRAPRAKLVVYHETNPPAGHRKSNIVWYDDFAGKKRFAAAMKRARYFVAYSPRAADFPALKKWGIKEHEVILHTVDLFEYVFKTLSWPGSGDLCSVSKLNGGVKKVIRADDSREEYQKQCQSDLKMLMHVFWKVVNGKFKCTKLGEISEASVEVPKEGMTSPTSPRFDLSNALRDMWLDSQNARFSRQSPFSFTPRGVGF